MFRAAISTVFSHPRCEPHLNPIAVNSIFKKNQDNSLTRTEVTDKFVFLWILIKQNKNQIFETEYLPGGNFLNS